MPNIIPGQKYSLKTGKNVGPQKPPPAGSNAPSPCLIKFPSISLGVANVGGGCIFSKTAARALIGGGVIVVIALPLTFVGIALLAAAGFQKSGMASKAADVAAVVPGGQPIAAGLRTAGRGGAHRVATGTVQAVTGTRAQTQRRTDRIAAAQRRLDSATAAAARAKTPAQKASAGRRIDAAQENLRRARRRP